MKCAKEIVDRSTAVALRKLKLVKPFEIAFVAGDVLMTGNNYAAKVVPINYFDYDQYVKAKSDGGHRLVTGRYVVFLDINLPFHADLALGDWPQIDPVAYYRSLNRFFGFAGEGVWD